MGRARRPHGSTRRKGTGGVRRRRTLLTGTIRMRTSGTATVSTPEGSFVVARGGVRQAMNGDEVQVSLVTRHGGARLAVVQGVLQHATTTFLGTYDVADPLGVVVPLDARIRRDFFVLPEDTSARDRGVVTGDVVLARILEYPARGSAGIVTIERRLGSGAGIDLAMETVMASHDLPLAFPEAALVQAETLCVDVPAALADAHRRDLRERCVLTIDPADARDFDDAVAARRLEHGGYEVEVHIADVSHYVAWGSPIDDEAKRRGCSVYLADRVIPMLPERLCNDVCSLRPGEDRLTMGVLLRLDAQGAILSADPCRSLIRSKARLSYDQADALLAGTLEAGALPCERAWAQGVADAIRVLDEVARLRQRIRHDRGAVDFATREAKVTLDDAGHPTGVVVRERTRATALIEEAMLMANESVARMLADRDIPCAYRVHERPSPDHLKAAVPILQELGLPGEAGRELVTGDPQALQRVLAEAAGTPAEVLVNSLLLRAQKRAVYLPHNEGHYALAAQAYCHFTSPIRRYPDVLVHRTLGSLMDGALGGRVARAIVRELPQLCRTSSERERVADAAERDSQKVKMAELFARRVGESFSGVVTGCERYGLFVMLDDSCAEGLVPVRDLGDEYFAYDEARLTLTGEESGHTWRVGRHIAVTVTGATPLRGQIDFTLAHGAAKRPKLVS